MFIFTAKVPRRKLALGVTLAALACCCLFALDLGPSPAQAAAASAPGVKGVRTNQDRVDFLRSFCWEVAEEPLATQEMVIPQEFDDSYAQYIDLQRQQGFDLERYAGKRAKRYTYEILNYPYGGAGQSAAVQDHRHWRRGPLPPLRRLSPRPGHAGDRGRRGITHFRSRMWTFRWS